ncbi:MAG TPA: peptidoglycan-binding domain-containing protein, partial [Anaerolineales bacterium]
MNKIFAKDFWNLESLKERFSQLRESFSTVVDDILKPANGKLDRKYKLALSLIAVVLLAVMSWIVGSKIQSPAEAAARTAPPTPSPILVPVQERILSSDVITRGTARFGLPQSISLAPSPLKSEPGVITTLLAGGDQLKEGDVLLTASGRPVFLLQGDIPAYRDLTSGLSGEDVRQLEVALKRLKFDPGPVDGVFDEKTSAAVTDLYTAAGYASFSPSEEHLASLHSLENELAIAVNEKAIAENTLALAPLAIKAAQAQRAAAVASSSGSAQAAAQLNGDIAVKTAEEAQKAAEREVKRLTNLVDELTAEFEAARSKTDSPMPTDEVVFIP